MICCLKSKYVLCFPFASELKTVTKTYLEQQMVGSPFASATFQVTLIFNSHFDATQTVIKALKYTDFKLKFSIYLRKQVENCVFKPGFECQHLK